MALEIFRLVGSIFVDSEAANKSISEVDNKAQGFGQTLIKGLGTAAKWGAGIVAAAGAGAAALYGVASKSAAAADEIDKMSQRLGLSRTAYQELDFVLSQAGVDITSFQTGAKSLLANMDRVTEGNKTAIANFEKLGVSVVNADGSLRGQEETMLDVIRAFEKMPDSAEKSRLAQELFGKQGQEILPLLNSEAGSMDELRQKAHDLGLVLSDDTIDAGVKFTDTIDQAKRSLEAVVVQIGAQVMPIFQQLLEWVLAHMPEIQVVIQTAFKIIEAVVKVVGDVIGWLAGIFEKHMPQIQDFVKKAFDGIKRLWENDLKPMFKALGDFLMNVLAPAFDKVFRHLILPIVQAAFKGISDLWNGTLKPIFSGIIDFITGVFTGNWRQAFEGLSSIVSGVFNGMITLVKFPINQIIGIINSFIGGLNKIKVPDWVPLLGGRAINIPQIPLLAAGGVLERGQVGLLEGNGAEAVVPLDQNRKWVSAVAQDMQQALGGGNTENLLAEILRQLAIIAKMGIYIDKDKLVGVLADPLDRKLGRAAVQKARA